MKHLVTLIIVTIAIQNLQGQITKKYELPGFVQINDTLFVSKFETSIRDYAAFLLYLKKKQKDSVLAEQSLPNPNTTDWTMLSFYKKTLTTFDNPLFELHDTSVSFTTVIGSLPVVNVSQKQASDYCNFKGLDYKIYLEKAKEKEKKKLPNSLFFRLLTKSEWAKAASFTADTSNIICLQFFVRNSLEEMRPMSIFQGSKNEIGLFNMAGNVAELVLDTGKAFGGSFKDNLQNCNSTNEKDLRLGEHNVGFRIAAVVR